MKSDSVKAGLMIAAVAGVAYLAWRSYSGVGSAISGAVGAVQQGATQLGANILGAWNNATGGVPTPGDPARAAMYSDAGYAGTDVNGNAVIGGDWYSDPEARTYDYTQRDAGHAPAATSINGAAFGIYPSSGKRAPDVDPTIADRWDYYTAGSRGASSGSGSTDDRSFNDILTNFWAQP